MNNKLRIYLADLTHDGSGVISSNVFPLGVGLIGATLLDALPNDVEVKLFKYPKDLSDALERRKPHIVGFSNYSWNCNLAYGFATQIKRRFPEICVIFGGPNYGMEPSEIEAFWRRYPLVDFHIILEGEMATLGLVKALQSVGMDMTALKDTSVPIPSCHYSHQDKIIQGELLPRIRNLEELPSPYLMGLMDKFFDNQLNPMIHTTRGCPFKCTFCTEGAAYYQKVAQRSNLFDELNYIGERIQSVTVQDLFITDANFGMYREDQAKARIIAQIQEKYGWPKRIYVSTGKNQKERVIEVASLVNGALNVTASLQSTDPEILKTIERTNISLDALKIIAERSTDVAANSYSEIILGLPGDTLQAHTRSLKDAIEAGLGFVRMYQLILLPQTKMNTPESREKYQLKTRFRLMPRSYGRYRVWEEDFISIESEEICIANSSMSIEDYFECRELDLTVEILHNCALFTELRELCKLIGYSWFDLMMRFHRKRALYDDNLTRLYKQFRQGTLAGSWETREDLESEVAGNVEVFLRKEEGTNEMAWAKGIAFFRLQNILHRVMFGEMKLVFEETGRLNDEMQLYLRELETLSRLRKANLLDTDAQYNVVLHFDFESLLKGKTWKRIEDLARLEPHSHLIKHTQLQKKMIQSYVHQYGTSDDGLGRICMRAPLDTLYRMATCV